MSLFYYKEHNLDDFKDKIGIFAGVFTAFVSGFFATMNLTIQNHNPGLTIFLYSITIISIIAIVIVGIIKFSKPKDYNSVINEIIDTKEKIDKIHFCDIKAKQTTSAKNIILSLNRKILNLFCDTLTHYCKEWTISINPNLERTEPVIYFREILDEISSENQKLLEETIEQNNIDKLSDVDFKKYKKNKLQLFLTNALNIRNSMYSDDICIVPLNYFIRANSKIMDDICEDELYKLLEQFREITIEENKNIEFLEEQIEKLKGLIK